MKHPQSKLGEHESFKSQPWRTLIDAIYCCPLVQILVIFLQWTSSPAIYHRMKWTLILGSHKTSGAVASCEWPRNPRFLKEEKLKAQSKIKIESKTPKEILILSISEAMMRPMLLEYLGILNSHYFGKSRNIYQLVISIHGFQKKRKKKRGKHTLGWLILSCTGASINLIISRNKPTRLKQKINTGKKEEDWIPSNKAINHSHIQPPFLKTFQKNLK